MTGSTATHQPAPTAAELRRLTNPRTLRLLICTHNADDGGIDAHGLASTVTAADLVLLRDIIDRAAAAHGLNLATPAGN